jgi:HlyD family secretion protein
MIILRSFSFYLAILGILLAILYSHLSEKPTPQEAPAVKPPFSPFHNYISASGIVEGVDKNIEIGSPERGVVEKLWFKVGDRVKKGDPLFQIDTRALRAKIPVEEADIEAAKANLKKYQNLLERVTNVEDPRSISKEDYLSRQDEVKIAEAKLKEAQAQLFQTQQLIERMLVRAPIDGTILQQNIRVGEYVTESQVPIILGDLDHLQLRVSIDEQNAAQFNKDNRAIAFPKNNTTMMFPLTFSRIEPYVIPKQSLTGSNQERVDTRVLQVLYSFDPSQKYSVYVGQQMDVFIEK